LSRKALFILILAFSVYTFLSIYRAGGYLAYAVPSASWVLVALATICVCGFSNMRSWLNKRVVVMAALIAILQIFILIDSGFVTGFGKSPYSFTPKGLTFNLIYVLSALVGMELSRAYLMKNYGKKKPLLTLVLVTLLYSFPITSIVGLLTINSPLAISEFLGKELLPTVTESLLASYLAFLSGPLASLTYRGPIQAFKWFSPILPDLPWGYESLIGVMTPTIGFIAINITTTQTDLRKAGIPTQKKPAPRLRKSQSSMKGWLAISVFLVLAVWTSTGLLGFYPTIIASGSMRPTMDVGDIAIVTSTDPSKIQVGDIIQYWQKEEMVLHRVIEIHQTDLGTLFRTQGDANDAPDPDPVFPNQIRGKLILTIPKIGWISIYIKTAIAEAISFFTNNIILGYATLTTIIAASTGMFYTRYNSPTNKLRRRMHR